METYKVLVSKSYQRDLKEIIHYISHNLDAPFTAHNFLDSIQDTVNSLKIMPYRYPLVKDIYLSKKGFRKCLVKNYIIFYKVDEDRKIIQVHRILHSKQNWLEIL